MMTRPSTPLFWTVTGRDYGRAIAWARAQPVNRMTAAIKQAKLTRRAKG